MTLHGVVPGASVTVPVVTAELRVRGHTFRLQVAVSELGGRTEVLVGIDVIERLWAAGVRIERLPNTFTSCWTPRTPGRGDGERL